MKCKQHESEVDEADFRNINVKLATGGKEKIYTILFLVHTKIFFYFNKKKTLLRVPLFCDFYSDFIN